MTRLRSAATWLAALLLATLGLVAPATQAQAASCSGVYVVVGTQVGCATSYTSGLDALRKAGFQVETVGSSFVCRIDKVPDTCTMSTPYWSYWHATRNADGTWSEWRYATRGSASYVPPAGSADGWAYGNGTPPAGHPPRVTTVAPATSTTSTSTKATTTTTAKAPATKAAGPTTTRATSRTTTSVPSAETKTTGTTTPSAAPSAGPAPVTSAASAGPAPAASTATDVASPASAAVTVPPDSGGTPTALLVTAGIVVAGAAGLGVWALQRRRPR